MGDESNENSLVYNHYLELSTPSKADFERVFTEDELKKLCLKQKCHVNMYRWNLVNDYRILFTKSGRYQRWSESVRLGTLAKAVNKMKHSVLYDEQEIIKTRKEDWDFQLKENILSLNYWQRKRQRSTEPNNSPRLVVTNSEDMDEGVEYADYEPLQNIPSTQSDDDQNWLFEVEEGELLIDESGDSEQSEEINAEIDNIYGVDTDSMTIDDDSEASEYIPSRQSDKDKKLLDEIEEFLIEESGDSVKTVLYDVPQLQSEEVIPEIVSQIIPASYDHFKSTIPLTSTQSQSQESEEII